MESVSTAELAEWLGYTHGTLYDLAMRHNTGGTVTEGVLSHSLAEVERFLATFTPLGAATPLALNDFRVHGLRLLRLSQACAMLDITPAVFRWQVRQAGLRAYKLHNHWRLVEADIKNIVAYRQQSLTAQQVKLVLSARKSVFVRLRESGWIKPLDIPEAHLARMSLLHNRYTRASLVETVRHLLAPGFADEAEAWIAAGLETEIAPLTTSEAMHALGIAYKPDLFRQADAHKIPYLGLFGAGKGDKRFLASGIRALFMAQPPLDIDETAATLGWEPDVTASWLSSACAEAFHDHSKGVEHRRACLIMTLAPQLSERLSPAQFLMARARSNNRPMVGVEAAAEKLGAHTDDVVYAAQIGTLPGIRHPYGSWLLLPTTVKTMNPAGFRLALAAYNAQKK